jgi:hypothetical protein
MIWNDSIKRDLLFFVLLIGMVKIAISRYNATHTGNPLVYISAATRSLHAPMAAAHAPIEQPEETVEPDTIVEKELPAPMVSLQEETSVESSPGQFAIHEVDQDIVQQIETAQAHINQLLKIVRQTSKQAAQLHSMQQRLAQLKKEYQRTCPAIALLGPIGTAGIVLKETTIEKNLLRMINMTRTILQIISGSDEQPTYTSIAQGLAQNGQLLAMLNLMENVILTENDKR